MRCTESQLVESACRQLVIDTLFDTLTVKNPLAYMAKHIQN